MSLILTRRIGEEIYLNDGIIKIKLLSINGNQASFSIDAPKDIRIDRKETHQKIQIHGLKTKDDIEEEKDCRGNR